MSNLWRELPKPFFVLAPMEDVTDYAFRELVATSLPRPHVFFTEFTSADALCSPGKEQALLKLKYSENQRPIVAQIWGSDPSKMEKAAKLVQELRFDGVDINMGCPDRAVVKIGLGCALADDMPRAKEMIDAVRRGAPNLPLSVKTRLGNKKDIADTWIPFLLEQKLAALTVHGRIGKQMSQGEGDWDAIGQAVQWRNEIGPETILVGNGDVESYGQGVEYAKRYGVDGIMIARGIFHNPWVFSSGKKEHKTQEYVELLLKHVTLFEQTYGEKKNFAIMKKFFKMYINSFPGAGELRVKLMECKSYASTREVLSSELIFHTTDPAPETFP